MIASVTVRATEVAALAAKNVVQKYSHTIESCICYCLATTHCQHVLSFYPEDRSCNVPEDAMSRCRENGPQLMLAAMTIVGKVGGQYHVLLIFADGQAGNGTLQSKSRCYNMKKDTELAQIDHGEQAPCLMTAYDVSLADDGWTPEIFNLILDNTSSSWERLDVCALSHTFELESIVKTEFHSKPVVVTFHVPTKVALQVGLENDPSWYCRHWATTSAAMASTPSPNPFGPDRQPSQFDDKLRLK
ncbi:hypothetical protein Tco_0700817 [Tanacetum coccineum]